MRYALAIVVVAACGSDGGMSAFVDANASVSDGPSTSDAQPLPHGLLVSWKAMPRLPGTIEDGLTVTSVKFNISRLQVIGDNGQPMTSAPFTIAWETFGDPLTVGFSSAPAGLYSQVAIEMNPAQGVSYEIRGTAKVGQATQPFYIHDTASFDVDITGYNVTFTPGVDATLQVRIDLQPPLETIDFGTATDIGGTLDVGPTDTQMAQFRDKLDDAFKR